MRGTKTQGKRVIGFLLALMMLVTILPTQVFAATQEDFLNGPYLLAPKSDSMVVVWETASVVKAKISYGTSANDMKTIDVAVEDGAKYKGEKMHMYRAKLSGLTPATQYIYKVELANGAKVDGSFKTLSTDPNEIKFVVVSDTHKFETAKAVGEAVAAFQPDFILHTGDMVEGTGTQKEQFTFWFQNNGDFLRNIPVLYNGGNHDFGEYFDEYVTKTQKAEYTSSENGRNISFNYGKTHFTMMDSNPWALFELNAASSGKIDAATRKNVDDALNWLKTDLAADAAKDAEFRVLTMHHPYEDELTRKYIPPIAEAGNVNVMFGGHTHVYGRTASPDPARGARTMYITQGDARIGDSKVDKGKEDERVNENLPEVLATGKGDMLEVTIKDGIMSVANVGLKGDKEEIAETVALSSKEPQLKFENVSITPASIQSGGMVKVSAKVTNTGTGVAAVAFQINDNGTDRYLYTFGKQGKERVVALDPGKTAVLSAELPLTALGKHTLKFAGATQIVDVTFRNATYTYDNLRIKLGDGEISDIASDKMNVKADVRNIGNEGGTASATLYIDEKEIEKKSVVLEAGATKSVEFIYDFAKYGDYKVRIGTSAEKTVSIEGIIQGTPIVRDQSGLNNNGIIRGTPTLVKYDKGYGLKLDGVKDYIEIPDNMNYKVDDGVTGMVWANVDRLAKEGEWDHNPLLMKGASISYGTNYLYRMAIRATGKITYGIGFDDDNGEFFWNDNDVATAGVKLGRWTQYTGAFDRKTGGVSWQDTAESGQIDAPAFSSPIKNWEGKSMYAGYSFHRHMLNGRDRGRTHTMLTGDIGQIRFYNTKLTDATNKAIFAAPSVKGAQGDKLVVWLNFDPKNIVTVGTHTTQWVDTATMPKTLSYDTVIPGAAAIKAVVETSNDGKTIVDSKEFALKDGANTLDLSALKAGGRVRIVTTFTSAVAEKSTDIPQLKSYALDTGKQWSTLAAWNQGAFADAAGYQPTDVFKDYSADFDDYSGK